MPPLARQRSRGKGKAGSVKFGEVSEAPKAPESNLSKFKARGMWDKKFGSKARIGFAAIGPNTEIQKSIQEAVLDKVEEDGGDPNAPQFAELQKDDETMRREGIRNLAIFGAMPMVYPLIVGFLLTGKRRSAQVEQWSESGPVA